MVSLQTFGNSSVKFTFLNNALYLNNGEITVPLNSLMLVIDESDLATFKKLNGDPFVSVSYSDLGMDKDELEQWYKDNMVGGGGSESGLTPSDVQNMIDASISGYDEDIQDEIGEKEQVIAIALTELKNDKADASALTPYFDDAEYVSSAHTIYFYNNGVVKDSIDASDFIVDGMIDDVRIETISGASYLVIDFNTASGKEDIMIPLTDIFDPSNYYTKADTDAAISAATSGKVDTTTYTAYTAATDTVLGGKQDTLTAGDNITISGNVISASVGNPTVELTQAAYDALVSGGTVDPDVFYIITDAAPIDLSIYMTSAETQSAITQAISGKADTSAVTEAIDAATSGKVDTSAYTAYTGATDARLAEDEEVTAAALNALEDKLANKLDISAYTPTDLSEYWTSGETQSAINAAVSGKADNATVTAHTANTAIHVSSNEKYNWNNKLDASAFNTYSAATDARLGEDEEVTAAGLNVLNDKFGGLRIVKLSQQEYDALVTKDSSTLYIVV